MPPAADITVANDHGLASPAYADWRDYVSLLKPRVMSLVVFTAFCGLVAAPISIHPVLAFTAILCVALGAGAAGALNMWWEADTDALMTRTANRAIPAGRISRDEALAFAMTLAVASVIVMGLAVNWLSAAVLAGSIVFYVLIYTVWLKRRTPQNIVIGGAAGAFPPVIGWAAATGDISALPVILFAIIFLWTPPHFWSMALFSQTDYGKAGIPMLPNVAGEKNTRLQIWLYTWPMVAVSLLPWAMGDTTRVYGISAAVLGFLFLAGSFQVWRGTDMKAPKQVFGYSILYLFVLFAVFAFDRAVLFAGVAA
jgi:heme o synthase